MNHITLGSEKWNTKRLVKDAPVVWNCLKGLICVYKPADTRLHHVRRIIINKICTELNEMKCRPPINHVYIDGDSSKDLSVSVEPSLADHPLVIGPRYQCDDLICSWSNYLGLNTSGVLLLGLRSGTKMAKQIRENRPTRAYRIKGVFGQATDDFYKTGKVVERTTFKHIKTESINRLLSYMQASHQKKMFELCGVDIQSQTAYELAIQGPIRPAASKIPVIYGIKCVHYESPEFTIEIQCVNEYEMYLKALIHEIGTKLHSSAHCTGIQCIRHSYFTLDNALLHRQWNLQNFITNLEECQSIISSHENLLHQKHAALQ